MGCSVITDSFYQQKHVIDETFADIEAKGNLLQTKMKFVNAGSIKEGKAIMREIDRLIKKLPDEFRILEEILEDQKKKNFPDEISDMHQKELDVEEMKQRYAKEKVPQALKVISGILDCLEWVDLPD